MEPDRPPQVCVLVVGTLWWRTAWSHRGAARRLPALLEAYHKVLLCLFWLGRVETVLAEMRGEAQSPLLPSHACSRGRVCEDPRCQRTACNPTSHLLLLQQCGYRHQVMLWGWMEGVKSHFMHRAALTAFEAHRAQLCFTTQYQIQGVHPELLWDGGSAAADLFSDTSIPKSFSKENKPTLI